MFEPAMIGFPQKIAKLAAWPRAVWNAAWKLYRGTVTWPSVSTRDPQAVAWKETLEDVIAELDLLNRNTESYFLEIGAKLSEFIGAVSKISTELTALVDLISGGRELNTSKALAQALDSFVAMRTRYADRNGRLAGLLREVASFRKALTGFEQTVVTFQIIGVLTRIESTELGAVGSGFTNLAEELESMAGQVQAKIDIALKIGERLIPPIESAMRNIAAIEEQQVYDLSEALGSLSSFRDIQDRARDSSVRLGLQFDIISAAFKKLIVSIQFHDITRQQVEHVIEVLRRVGSEYNDAVGANSNARRSVASVLELQSAQLAHAADKFAESVASVAQNLNEIASHIGALAGESRTLSGASANQKDTFFLQMEHGCIVILGHVRRLTEADAATRVTNSGLGGTIEQMGGAIEEIRIAEVEMHRMAVNAGVHASQIGVPGNALSVLAGAMQERAFESSERSERLLEGLSSISAATVRAAEQNCGPAFTGGSADNNACLSTMLTAVAELHASGERSTLHIAEIIASGARLREDISATRDGFSVGVLFKEAVGRARERLRQIRKENQFGLPPGGEPSDLALLDIAQHYSMQSEHDVHASATGATAEPGIAVLDEQAESSPPKNSEELGENVEFF